jgi:hypothetical protein
MENKQVVRGLRYVDGEWTGEYFQPTLYCKHIRESLVSDGWAVEDSGRWYSGAGIHKANEVIISQKCEHANA